MNLSTPFAIFSAQLGNHGTEANRARNASLHLQILKAGLNVSQVRGSYKGVEEDSFLVLLPEGDGSAGFETVARLARVWEQESFLYVDANRYSTLHFVTGMPEIASLGRFHAVSEPVARQRDGWTRDAVGTYYVVGES